MLTVDLEIEEGHPIPYGILTIFSLNGDSYAAMIPLKDDGAPAKADVMLCGCDVPENEEEDMDFYLINDRDEYRAAERAFQKVVKSL